MIQTYTTTDIKLTAAQRRREQAHFEKVRRAETTYAIQLRKIARHISDLINNFDLDEAVKIAQLQEILHRYSQIIVPWSGATAARMIAEVARRDETAWFRHAERIGRGIRKEIREAPIGPEVKRIQREQVQLITSLPIEAGNKVQELARKAVVEGRRYSTIIPEIQSMSSSMTLNRATLIARTEVAKTSSAITQVRARHIGVESYIWRTVRDNAVRRMHRRLEGTSHTWANPPVAEEQGQRHHPGEFPNCRCFAEPIL
jgi:SPP1 gp7 family putative phage head morphogenesis protein